jgi:hypothetical protein
MRFPIGSPYRVTDGHFRQNKRRASMLLGHLLNIPCSAAWTVKIQNLFSQAIAAPYEQIRIELEKQPQLFVDQSPTQEKKQVAWLWSPLRHCLPSLPFLAIGRGDRSSASLATIPESS